MRKHCCIAKQTMKNTSRLMLRDDTLHTDKPLADNKAQMMVEEMVPDADMRGQRKDDKDSA